MFLPLPQACAAEFWQERSRQFGKFVRAVGLSRIERRRFDRFSTAIGGAAKKNIFQRAIRVGVIDGKSGIASDAGKEFLPSIGADRFDSSASVVRILDFAGMKPGRRAKDAEEVTTDDKEIVSALRTSLADKVGQERFELWFGGSPRLDYDGRRLLVGAPNQFFVDWIRANFRPHIEGACHEVLGKCPSVEYHIDVMGDSKDNGAGPPPMAAGGDTGQSRAPRQRPADEPRTASPVKTAGGTPRRRFARLDTFCAGEANRLPLSSAETAARQPGKVTPLVFFGPTGVGKTHLLEGIWSGARKLDRGRGVVYLSAEQFTNYFVEAVRGSGLPNFRQKYRGVGVLMLDDLQFFVGKRATQVELLHTIDGFLREGRQLVFAADRSPAELAELGTQLTTRLASGLVCRIEPPDYASRLGIIAQVVRRRSIDVPLDVQQLIAARITNNARELSGALCRLQATSEALGRPISLGMAEEALADLLRHSGRVVRLADIEKAVCDVFGIEPASLQSEAKAKRVSCPRMLAMWLARKHTRAALSEIGHFFGRRSHSTVISAQKRVEGWMATGCSLVVAERQWPAADAVRQVERRLEAG
jgi:chromosomal replication initiator protein